SGNTNANGTFFVQPTDANNFQLIGTTPNGTYTGGGTWRLAPYTVDANPIALAVADTNGDGHLDVVTVNTSARDFSLLLGNGVGTAGTFTTATDVAAADFNKDGKIDLAVSFTGGGGGKGGGTSGGAVVLFGNGNRTFQNGQTFAAGTLATAVGVGDFNKDGNP